MSKRHRRQTESVWGDNRWQCTGENCNWEYVDSYVRKIMQEHGKAVCVCGCLREDSLLPIPDSVLVYRVFADAESEFDDTIEQGSYPPKSLLRPKFMKLAKESPEVKRDMARVAAQAGKTVDEVREGYFYLLRKLFFGSGK